MKIWISGADSEVVTCLALSVGEHNETTQLVCVDGSLPKGLALEDLSQLGIVTYQPDGRGRPIPKVSPIHPSENLDYLRALIEAMPPGYFISKVESEKIDKLREEKALRFHEELEHFTEEGS